VGVDDESFHPNVDQMVEREGDQRLLKKGDERLW
jgi:hypothetical protein